MNRDRKPLPRFWYFPRGEKAAVVMTGDDHGNGGTAGRFDQLRSDEPGGLLGGRLGVRPRHLLHLSGHAAHECAGGRLPARGLRDRPARAHRTARTSRLASLEAFYASQLAAVRATARRASPAPATNRTHCIAWSDWADQPKVELEHGIRLRHELLLLARAVDPGPARHVHRLRHADALRRPRRLA